MERSDYIHLVKLSELASAQNSNAYRRSVLYFAALGYLWVIACLCLAVVMTVWPLQQMFNGHIRVFHFLLLLAAVSLLWNSLSALWVRLDKPPGVPILPNDAPMLFAALEKIRKKINAPRIHHVLLDSEFNASISQYPRFGLFGGSTNYLILGLPMLLAVDSQRLMAILSHEYGHLHGGHGKFSSWIYRTRLSWSKLYRSMGVDMNVVAGVTKAFLDWYYPRFLAKTFAIARQNEYEADNISATLAGQAVATSALIETEIKYDWLSHQFWPMHWNLAANSTLPIGPFAAMHKMLMQPVPDDFAQQALTRSLKTLTTEHDTHPGLRDRLQALNVRPKLPAWSSRPALEMLGSDSSRWIKHFDNEWCKENTNSWKFHHAYLQRVKSAIASLQSHIETNNANEMVQLAQLMRRLNHNADIITYYQRALQLTPGHFGALRGLVTYLPDHQLHQRLDYLKQLYENSINDRWWASNIAIELLKQSLSNGGEVHKELSQWQDRLKLAGEAENRAWDELTKTSPFQSITRQDLNEFEEGELKVDLIYCKPVARAWLVRKNLKQFTTRRCYILFIELPGLIDNECYRVCEHLEQTLDLPGPVLVFWAGGSFSLEEIKQNTFGAIYVRQGK